MPRDVYDTRNGAWHHDKIFLGVAFTCGLEKVVVPFIDRGLTPEYELVRSLCTVTKQKRKRVGVLETDAHVMGGYMAGMAPEWMLIQELKKQYEVVSVNPAELMTPTKPGEAEKHYDVLLAVQPSAMGPKEMEGFISAIRDGQPTVIFEDPFLFTMGNLPGTYQPRRQQQQNPMMGNSPEAQEKATSASFGGCWVSTSATAATATSSIPCRAAARPRAARRRSSGSGITPIPSTATRSCPSTSLSTTPAARNRPSTRATPSARSFSLADVRAGLH